MINRQDNKYLQSLYTEMNIGFAVPQNGGVSAQTVAIVGKEPDAEPDTSKDVGQLIGSVVDDLNHLKMDVDQGCRGDAQIDQLQKCCDALAQAIEQIGNTSSSQHQNGAFTGAIDNNNNLDTDGEGGSSSNMFSM